ncbi:D-serine deaminase-like pyridoxal phosphate-dependent protein [Neorhizobium huautlense]|uniref:D-serine deaminase-like pyridoxal phosphate-dependent protein n=1 Tax=Neorhizobium huautlense TaxID=67774 RepID=A0ABT9PPX6_9HYPH|nr:alanine racemase [Neorhizobium huautlense]MDP9836517.1 D-serine deaminase-like pyridoxal phosphate-dependent protein [Neorhizobium huautlense]
MSNQPSSPLDLSTRFRGFDALNEPRVVIDEAVLRRNIEEMTALVGGRAALHPHIKTHKSLEIARLQKENGAAGFTTARPYEAAMLLRDGLFPVTLAYPLLNPQIIAGLLREATSAEDIRFIADSDETVDALIAGAKEAGRKATVFMKVDVGLHRCGVDPSTDTALKIAAAITGNPDLTFAGLLSHAGHAYGAGNAAAVTTIAESELAIMTAMRQKLQNAGIEVPRVSIGSTPTLVKNAGFEGVDEVRPGNYVFYDLTAVRLGLVERNNLALGVAARIIAVNDHYAIANVGSKTLSSDLGPHGTSATKSFGEAWMIGHDTPLPVAKLSEEHAFLEFFDTRPKVGTPLLILPNHSCPVANLSGGMLALGGEDSPAREIHVEGFVGNWR